MSRQSRGPDSNTGSDRAADPDGSTPLSTLTAEHAKLLSEIGTELSESSDAIESLSRGAVEANKSSSDTASLAETARGSAREANDDVDEAKAAAAAAEQKLETLRETVTEIDDIVAMLNEIADQTNMLALNASIEAARVGEAGSGFAVVADEVKDLAEQAQERATEIEATVEEVRSTADETIDQIETVDTRTDTAAASIT
ncbi:methyl-accepting chemotaxis protein, partial [Halorubrum miltondacostae]